MTPGMRGQLGMALAAPAILAATSSIIGGAEEGVRRVYDSYQKGKAFKEMVQTHPALKREDHTRVKKIYSTLSTFSPEFAKDPAVAGAWVTNVIRNDPEEPDSLMANQALLKSVSDLAGVSSNFARARSERARGRSQFAPVAARVLGDAAGRLEAGMEIRRREGTELAKLKADLEQEKVDAHIKRQTDARREVTEALNAAINRRDASTNRNVAKWRRVLEKVQPRPRTPPPPPPSDPKQLTLELPGVASGGSYDDFLANDAQERMARYGRKKTSSAEGQRLLALI
jgi:hypothetical protein